jgi:hypothetical protein
MTKKFCDKCSEEVVNSEFVRMSFSGNIDKHFIHKEYHFCEKCFADVNKKINESLP